MAAYTDIISIIGGAASNSYVSGAETDSFAALQSWGDAWLAKSESERTIAIVSACSWLETVDWEGTRCTPSTTDEGVPQALSWPRSGASCDGVAASCTMIPNDVKRAQILLAYQLVVNPDAITGQPGGGGGAAAGTFVSKQQLGDLVQEFSAFPSGESASNDCTSCANPEVISKFPWLTDILGCWADISSGTGGKVILRVRA